AAGARPVVGYRRGWRRPLLDVAVPRPPGAGRRMWIARERHVLGLVEALGCPARGTHLELFTTPEEEAAADAALGPDAQAAPLALLAPGASFGPSKLWPAESFAAVGDALAGAGARIAVIGSPGERPLVARVVAAMRAPARDLAGAVSLGGLKAVVRRARVLVCNDAGARHLAVAFGVPTVVLMGPTALEKTDMNLEQVKVLSADVACRPCYRRECPIDHRCMTRIAPETVAAAALPALAADAARSWRGERLVAGGGAA
ncbi:MAG: glycosyltransferase family 9 protein, partial [Myxococcota bacterium]|nr:glycosyltransferase family 9 protein [Myxococcota bacterium]